MLQIKSFINGISNLHEYAFIRQLFTKDFINNVAEAASYMRIVESIELSNLMGSIFKDNFKNWIE